MIPFLVRYKWTAGILAAVISLTTVIVKEWIIPRAIAKADAPFLVIEWVPTRTKLLWRCAEWTERKDGVLYWKKKLDTLQPNSTSNQTTVIPGGCGEIRDKTIKTYGGNDK